MSGQKELLEQHIDLDEIIERRGEERAGEERAGVGGGSERSHMEEAGETLFFT